MNPVSKEEAAMILQCVEECVINHCITTDDLLKWMRFAAMLGDGGITLDEVKESLKCSKEAVKIRRAMRKDFCAKALAAGISVPEILELGKTGLSVSEFLSIRHGLMNDK